jgi:ketosteroid isomerase-like protein
MSQENVEIVRQCAEAMNGHLSQVDLSEVFELCEPDVEIDLSRNVFNPEIYRGRAGLERWRSVVEDVWDDFQGVLDEIVVAGDDKVVTKVTLRGRGKESGVEVKMHVFQIWTLRDSKVVRLVGGYRGRSEALEAAGLSE